MIFHGARNENNKRWVNFCSSARCTVSPLYSTLYFNLKTLSGSVTVVLAKVIVLSAVS